MATNSIKLLTGNSHPQLAKQVADRYVALRLCFTLVHAADVSIPRRLGIELTRILVIQYSNQETSVTIGESVRDEDGPNNVHLVLACCKRMLTPGHFQSSYCRPRTPAPSMMDLWSFSS